MNRSRATALAMAIGAALLLSACAAKAEGRSGLAAATAKASSESSRFGTITVSGHGVVEGTPDTVTISIGVNTRAKTASQALSENNAKAQALIDTVKQSGVAARDIQTSQLSISPTWDDKNTITGYEASNHVTVEIHKVGSAGTIIDTVASKVGDSVRLDGVAFSINDTSSLVSKARADAIKRAKAQAGELADAAGIELGRIKTIDETNRVEPYPRFYAADEALSRAGAPIEAGTQELSLDVKVVYEIVQ